MRLLIIVACVMLIGVETIKSQISKPSPSHFVEIFIYLVLLYSLGMLVEILTRPYAYEETINVLGKVATMILQKVESLVARSAKYFRVAIAFALIVLVGVETAEFEFNISDTFHIGEIIIYFLLLGLMGLLVEVILRSQQQQQRSMDLLGYKHKLSLDVLPYQNWNALTTILTRQVAEIVDARAAYLFFHQPYGGDFESIAEWTDGELEGDLLHQLDCMICIQKNDPETIQPHYCDFSLSAKTQHKTHSYCYPIVYQGNLYAVFRFFLKPGKEITNEQQDILANIQDEIIISLMAGQDRIRISELEVAETALAERHNLSNYLHDHLGQNLGYLRMKLEQFVNRPELFSNSEELKADLLRMKAVVDESYRSVRNKLEVTIPDSTPLLTNYLHEHAKKVAMRSNIDVNFISRGISRTVPMELQQAVFFVFQEALSNVEKHSHASQVNVLLEWDPDQLNITVIDNGTGFDMDKVSTRKHFGLEIMKERMAGIGGDIKIISSESTGTILKIFAPLPLSKKQESIIQHETR